MKQVTARFNAENLITNRETVKSEIENQIKQRLASYNVEVETISITEFQFSEQFRRAVESKVEAEQRALQATNELRRIEIEAQQAEAKAVGEQKANVAHAEGIRQANVLEAQGESQAIKIIDEQLRENPTLSRMAQDSKVGRRVTSCNRRLKVQHRSYRSHQKDQTVLFKKWQRQQLVPMAPQLQHRDQQEQQQQEIQHNQQDKAKADEGKAEGALFFRRFYHY